MKVAIMQPYFLPYIGYFQLIGSVDAFVIYDDVNFIKGGWINRNFILAQGNKHLFTLPLQKASPHKLINEVSIGGQCDKIIKTIHQNYSKSPQFASVFPLVEDILNNNDKSLVKFLDYGLRQISKFLGLSPCWYVSSALKKDTSLRGEEKVLAICEELRATEYINPPGGKSLYSNDSFIHRGIQLSFIQPKSVVYHQFGNEFVPNLSIIDVMMFNDRAQCATLLNEYDLV